MRIISGNFKNKKLLLPSNNYTRPLKDLVKESIFNIIESILDWINFIFKEKSGWSTIFIE